jgi:dTMP kinase
MLTQGCLIIFEGIDGTGKSTQLQLLNNALLAKGYDVVTTREPTNGSYGQKI